MEPLDQFKAKDYVTGDDCIHVFKSRVLNDQRPHTHDFIELVYVTSGKMRQVINGKQYTVRRGDMLFMAPGCVHAFSYSERGGFVNIIFSPSVLRGDLIHSKNALALLALSSFDEMRSEADFGKISFFGEERDEVERLVNVMLKEHGAKRASFQTVLENCLNSLFVYMLRRVQDGLEADDVDEVWQNLSAYIDAHLESRLSLSDLAEKCFYNPSYFSRVFKEKFGTSFLEYVTRKRVESAVRLLKETALSVDEISIRVGFADRSSFYHAFSRYEKGTPLELRRAVVKKQDTSE